MSTTAAEILPSRTKIFRIPSLTNAAVELVVELDEKPSDAAIQGLVIVCHGLLNDRQSHVPRSLGRLPQHHVLRVDFRGNGESSGETGYGNYAEEAEDLQAVVCFAREHLCTASGYGPLVAIAGHSKAASVVLLWADRYHCIEGIEGIEGGSSGRSGISLLLLSGRFDMQANPSGRFTEEQMQQLATKGRFLWKTMRSGAPYYVTQEQWERKFCLDMHGIATRVRERLLQPGLLAGVLVVHGTEDRVVPVQDAHAYCQALGTQRTGLKLLEGVDHFYKTPPEMDALLSTIQHFLISG